MSTLPRKPLAALAIAMMLAARIPAVSAEEIAGRVAGIPTGIR